MAKYNRIKNCLYCKTSFHAICPSHIFCSSSCRFWIKVDIRSPFECWNWLGTVRSRYGDFPIIRGISVKAHRYAWLEIYGSIPEDIFILHHCDNPLCCNPEHLFLGTQYDNVHDMISKGRRRAGNVKGERHGRAKLKEIDVLNIRYKLNFGLTGIALAYQYNVSPKCISVIKNRLKWTHI